jgi:hypothetical protein
MKTTLLEKWNHYLSIVNQKTTDFINSQKEGKTIPSVYYIVHPVGRIAERKIIDVEYSHYNHGGKTFFNGEKPTRKDIAEITEYSTKEIPFSVEYIWFKYSEIWDKEKGSTSTSSVKFNDIINEKGLFFSLADAEILSQKVLDENRIEKEFKELHKKDGGYKYNENGYKFLGWQNGWKHAYFDADGNVTDDATKRKTFGYLTADYPEYGKCREQKHRTIEVSHNQRGSENTVSCPICKIYWKYDCSD